MVLHEAVRKGAGPGVLACFSGDDDPLLVRLTPPIAIALRRFPSLSANLTRADPIPV